MTLLERYFAGLLGMGSTTDMVLVRDDALASPRCRRSYRGATEEETKTTSSQDHLHSNCGPPHQPSRRESQENLCALLIIDTTKMSSEDRNRRFKEKDSDTMAPSFPRRRASNEDAFTLAGPQFHGAPPFAPDEWHTESASSPSSSLTSFFDELDSLLGDSDEDNVSQESFAPDPIPFLPPRISVERIH
jgi:hypothetical protein